jgi:dipeptidyl aminopeptidase/acylaminoacyl peptidase
MVSIRGATRPQTLFAACTLLVACVCTRGEGSPSSQSHDGESRSSISPADLARFAVVGDPQTLDWNDDGWSAPPGLFSPDGHHVAVIVRRGDPDTRSNEATLTVYRTSDLGPRSSAVASVRFASTSNYQPIAYAKWLDDSQRLLLAGTNGEEHSQIYELDLRDSAVRPLTHEREQIVWYGTTARGSHVVTLSERPKHPPANDAACIKRGCRISVDRLFEVDYGSAGSSVLKVHNLGTGMSASIAGPESFEDDIDFCDDALFGEISPDGRYALRRCTLRHVPQGWSEYAQSADLVKCWQQRNVFCARKVMLIDLQSGATVALSDAPSVWNQPAPIWIDGGRSVVLIAAIESLSGTEAAERAARAQAWSVLVVDPAKHTARRITRLDSQDGPIVNGSWSERTQTLTFEVRTADGGGSRASFRRSGAHWRPVSAVSAQERPIELYVAQTLNERPVLRVRDRRNGTDRMVLDPNPWLAERRLGRVEAVEWHMNDGLTWTGGLYFPPDYDASKRYPLLIQTHGFEPKQFSLCGASRLFPGQALAAHGVIVLQVDENFRDRNGDRRDTPREWTTAQAGYEAAIDYLDSRKLIDTDRVGVQGWSRTGPQLGYLLTHSSYPIAAAALTETGDFGWLYYVNYAGPRTAESLFGAAPFGEGLTAWARYSPTFNLDKIKTPIFIWGSGTGGGNWDWYGGLRALNKPVEHWISPGGTHDVFQIEQRLQVTQLLVDWFRFWLTGQEDPATEKLDQYRRWRALRDASVRSSADLAGAAEK